MEAAIGAGLSGALLLAAVGDQPRRALVGDTQTVHNRNHSSLKFMFEWTVTLLCVALAGVLAWALAQAFERAPVDTLLQAVGENLATSGVSNPVTAVLLNFRAYDTLLELAVLFEEVGRVLVLEARETIGGGMRTAEVTLPGFQHDICSVIHPLGMGSPFFRDLPLAEYGLRWIQPDLPLAHPFDDGSAAIVHQSLDCTAEGLGADGSRYRRLFGSLVMDWDKLAYEFLGPLRFPRYPLAMANFGVRAIWPARSVIFSAG